MAARPTIRLTIPGTLEYRAVAVRVVAEACRMVSAPGVERTADGNAYDLRHPFDAEFVSAFAEIFNNIAIHAYQRRAAVDGGEVDIAIAVGAGELDVEIRDHGKPFDIDAVSTPDLDSLPEGGMGIHIARALLDEVIYEPGPPNLWRLHKQLSPSPTTAATTSAGTSA
ncbi:MAG: ATP-binding protein [Kofleriaceae bacterium]|nr:ATP-binding protein [Myxococcales bacterium]MCB9561115.1 ATP-binding protein [Kofleriaceae bacterium]